MINGWLLTNKYFVSNSFINVKKLLLQSAHKKNINLIEYNNIDIVKVLQTNYVKPDFVLFWDKDTKLATYLECVGIKVYNSSNSIRLCDDKSLTYLELLNKNIRQPLSFFSPFLFLHNLADENEYLDFVIDKLKFPFVFKECFGSFGKQVSLVYNRAELINQIDSINGRPFLMQEFIKSSFGKDLRLYIVGNECVATMKRENFNGDFRANIEVGSKGEKYNATASQINLALEVVRLLKLSFAGIDLLFDEYGEPIFCEANSNAYFNEIDKVVDVKVEDKIFDYIINDYSKNQTN